MSTLGEHIFNILGESEQILESFSESKEPEQNSESFGESKEPEQNTKSFSESKEPKQKSCSFSKSNIPNNAFDPKKIYSMDTPIYDKFDKSDSEQIISKYTCYLFINTHIKKLVARYPDDQTIIDLSNNFKALLYAVDINDRMSILEQFDDLQKKCEYQLTTYRYTNHTEINKEIHIIQRVLQLLYPRQKIGNNIETNLPLVFEDIEDKKSDILELQSELKKFKICHNGQITDLANSHTIAVMKINAKLDALQNKKSENLPVRQPDKSDYNWISHMVQHLIPITIFGISVFGLVKIMKYYK